MRLTFALIAALLLFAAPARAAGPEIGIADDRILMAGGPLADQTVAEWAELGVQHVRLLALWSRIVPNDPEGPYQWGPLDGAVDRVVAAGMTPMLTLTGPGPLWTSRRSERGEPRYDPDPKLFAEFAEAVAERYADRVNRYIIFNEPNLGTWLRPQASCNRSGCTSVSPHLYRALVRASYPVVHAADPDAQVLVGSMSSRGGAVRHEDATHRPLAFLRAFGCVDRRFRKLTTGRCRNFKPAPADGLAFHPHGGLTPPDRPFHDRDDVNVVSIGRLVSTLDRLTRAKRVNPSVRRLGIYIDEYGYQTNPPDRIAGISLTQQDQWLQRAGYEAWRNPRVKLLTHYLYFDEPCAQSSDCGAWQSGLRFVDGRSKPALRHYPAPFVLDARRNRLWGQVRRRDADAVTVQRRSRGSSRWRTIGTRTTDAQGYWSWTKRLVPGASYRYLAAGATSATLRRR